MRWREHLHFLSFVTFCVCVCEEGVRRRELSSEGKKKSVKSREIEGCDSGISPSLAHLHPWSFQAPLMELWERCVVLNPRVYSLKSKLKLCLWWFLLANQTPKLWFGFKPSGFENLAFLGSKSREWKPWKSSRCWARVGARARPRGCSRKTRFFRLSNFNSGFDNED